MIVNCDELNGIHLLNTELESVCKRLRTTAKRRSGINEGSGRQVVQFIEVGIVEGKGKRRVFVSWRRCREEGRVLWSRWAAVTLLPLVLCSKSNVEKVHYSCRVFLTMANWFSNY